ncbi:MAG: class I SAM-dependent methyltransferase [Candidatus Omnitrophica bacterium]|nr:class I SAM-dependent methyltransferase [Candidatus Omnitrophota bacterium]
MMRAAAWYQQQWDAGIRLQPERDLVTNFLDELEAYSRLPRAEVEALFYHGTEAFAQEWEQKYKTDPQARVKFYDEALTHIFFVMHNSALRTHLSSPLLYVYAAEWARQSGARRYLDYGSGTGSGAIFFARSSVETTLADISSRMLDFARWRLERRGLAASYLDVKMTSLPRNHYDFITCFHVLQHVEDPIATLRQLREALTDGGILIVNGALRKDPDRPMQPDHGGARTTRHYRSVGFQILWERNRAMRHLSNTNPIALQRVERPAVVNGAYLAFDSLLASPVGALTAAAARAVRGRKARTEVAA